MQFKNRFLKWIILLWKKCFSTYAKKPLAPRYLIVSTTGLGDTLWGTPAIAALKKSQPHAYIAVLTSPIGEEILRHNPYVDKIFSLKKSFFSHIQLIAKMRREELQVALVFHISQRMALPLVVFSGVSEIIGSLGINKGLDFLLTHSLPRGAIHEIERRLEIVQQIGAGERETHLAFFLAQQDRESAEQFLTSFHLPASMPLVGIHAGAKDAFKRWPPSHYIRVAEQLQDQLGCQIILTGTPEETPLIAQIASKLPRAIPCSHLPLGSFAALLEKFSLFITNDTGPMHIASALDIPTVALFSPTHPNICGPYLHPHATIIHRDPTCTPCLRKKCQMPFCLLQISPQQVIDAALELYKRRSYG